MKEQDKTPTAPAAGQNHGDPNFKANLWNQAIVEELNSASVKGQFRKWLKNKGKGLDQDVAGQMPGQCEKEST